MKPATRENETEKKEKNIETTKEQINRTLRKIHKKMVELFDIDFTYFRDVKIIKQPDILEQLTRRMRNNLRENGVIYSDTQWKQISESLSKNSFLENLAFYSPEDDVLYMNEKMITNHPEKIITVCTHELAEKLLSNYLPPHLKMPVRALLEAYAEVERTNNPAKLYELMNKSTETVFKSVFKEGACEAIAIQTLRHTDLRKKAASLENELETGHSKCIHVLFNLDKQKGNPNNNEKTQARLNEKRQDIDRKKLLKETLRIFQIIKGISYYLGYPLAKAVLERHGIRGVRLALEKYPPNKSQYFANPHTYLTWLEKLAALTE